MCFFWFVVQPLAVNVEYNRSSGIGALTFRFMPDFKFIKLLSGFALTRYCVYAMLCCQLCCFTMHFGLNTPCLLFYTILNDKTRNNKQKYYFHPYFHFFAMHPLCRIQETLR